MTSILEKFHQIAADPKGQKNAYLKAGKKIVAVAPIYTPEEIIHSMGLVPMGAWGADCELSAAKEYFPAFIASEVQSILELGIRGTYEGISALVIPSLSDALKCLGENWKYAVPSIPFIPMTYPQNRRGEVGCAFTKAGYERVIADLEKATGAQFDDAALAKSIAVYNEHNAVMRELDEVLAVHPEVSAAARSDVFKSAMFMLKEEHTVMVKELTAGLKAQSAGAAKVGIMTSGIHCDSPDLLKIIDDCGLQIVADDIAAESRQYRVDAPAAATALDSLTLKFEAMDNCSFLYDPYKLRADLIVSTAKARGAKGVVIVLSKFCDSEEFDYVIIKKTCEAAELPIVLVEIDRQMTNYGQARTILETFKDLL